MTVREEAVGRFATAVDGQGNQTAVGFVLAYSIVPQVLIEEADGTREWHRHDQAQLATVEEVGRLLKTLYRSRWATGLLVPPPPPVMPDPLPDPVIRGRS